MSGVKSEGPFGVPNAGAHDFNIDAANKEKAPVSLVSIQIWTHNEVISGIMFTYKDKAGPETKGPFGQIAAAKPWPEIIMGVGEVVTKVSGYFAEGRITSLTVTTNIAVYGPFGKTGGTPFETTKKIIVAFFGNYSEHVSVNAIGTYYIKE